MVRITLLTQALLALSHTLPVKVSAKSPSIHEESNHWPHFNHFTHFPNTKAYPLPNPGNIAVHDPNILQYNNSFYLFRGGHYLPIFKAPNITGPWTSLGTVLDGPSIIKKQNRTRPWAPTTIEKDGKFYCFYTISKHGIRNSAIGVATADDLDSGEWKDHGALIETGKGHLSHLYPYRVSNAIDPAFITDQKTGQPYLIYGSYWHDIFQVPLSDDLLQVKDRDQPDAKHLAYVPNAKVKPVEGSFMSYRDPYYYLWFSHGKCCHFENGFPDIGEEYSIRVGRSKDVRGPFVDKNGRKLDHGGGTIIYGSNHGVVYAPGGVGVLSGNSTERDILYFHYLNTTIGFLDRDAHLGWTFLEYQDGWPVANATGVLNSRASMPSGDYVFKLVVLMSIWAYVWIYG